MARAASGTLEVLVLVLVFKRQESSRNKQDYEHRLRMHSSTRELVELATDHIREQYPSPDSAERAVTALEDLLRMDRDASPAGDLPTVCATLSEVLQQATGDLHLRVIHHPAGAPDPEDEEGYARYWTGDAARTAGGIQSVRRLGQDNIAVLQIGPFLGLPEYAGTWQAAAMSLCQGAAAVILDCAGAWVPLLSLRRWSAVTSSDPSRST